MKAIIESLTQNERKILKILFLIFILFFLFLIFNLTWQKSQVSRLETKLEAQKKSLEKAKEAKDKSEQQWLFWSEASHQLKELKTKWFYRAEEGMRQIRIDLDEIFREARLSLPVLQYNYQDLEKGKIRKVSFNLRLKTSYLALRELIARLESFPRFLLLEDIDFPNIIEADSNLDLRLVISAYYVYQ